MFGPCDSIPSQRPRASGRGDTWRWATRLRLSSKAQRKSSLRKRKTELELLHVVTHTQCTRNPVSFLSPLALCCVSRHPLTCLCAEYNRSIITALFFKYQEDLMGAKPDRESIYYTRGEPKHELCECFRQKNICVAIPLCLL